MKPSTDLTGKVAVITGAARGLGLALALRAADRGMRVALADENEYLLAASLEQVKAKGVEAIAVHSDMLDYPAVCELAQRCTAELGPPWLVCNNPGLSIEVNLSGVINGVRVFAPDIVKRGAGHIVNIVDAELLGIHGTAPYVATTHAIMGLSEALYRELDLMGSPVGVTLVCPPLDNTNITSAPQLQNFVRRSIPDVPLKVLPDEELAEQIYAAVAARRFQVYPFHSFMEFSIVDVEVTSFGKKRGDRDRLALA